METKKIKVGTMYQKDNSYYRIISSNENDALLAECNELGWTLSEESHGEIEDDILFLTEEYLICDNINNALVYKDKSVSYEDIACNMVS